MSKFIEALVAELDVLLADPVIRTALFIPLVVAPFSMIVRLFSSLMGSGRFSFASFVVDAFSWLGEKIVDLMCKSERGFHIAYKFGWAKSGVHYFDCGVDCDKCPKYDQCTDENRILRDVTQMPGSCRRSDPDDMLQDFDPYPEVL